MPPTTTVIATVTNQLLGALPNRLRRKMLSRCELVELAFGVVLCEPGQRILHVYFPTSSFISLIATLTDVASLEVGLIGSEGMLGVSVALGVDISPIRAVVLRPGYAMRMPTADFRDELEQSPMLQRDLGRYTHMLLAQLARTAACTCFHLLDARLARCLLMTHDRSHGDRFYLTHLLLSEMLGVRRGGVTKAAGELQRRRLIHYSRGDITIIDRKGLEGASCECYRAGSLDAAQFLG